MSESNKLQIAIVGAGIAGLTAAIALANHPGVDVQIFERATELKEIGASIALGPNGMRTLDRLGIHNALDDDVAFRNTKTKFPHIYRHWKTNEIVSVDNYQGHVDRRHYTSRFYRAHLQQSLLAHISPSKIHLGKSFDSVTSTSPTAKLSIRFTDGTAVRADILLGSDGIHSPVRRHFVPTSAPKWTGWVALRSVFPISHVSHIADLPDEANHYWGPDRALFISKLGKDLFTVVGSYQSDPDARDTPYKDAIWDQDGDVNVLREYYKDWNPTLRAIVNAVPHTRIYPNAAAHGLDSWVLGNGRVTLAGDAAHAHGGAFAAGGSLAIDDAWAFAAAIKHVYPEHTTEVPSADDISRALRIYDGTRRAHTDRVLRTVHAGNKAKVARIGKAETDEELRNRIRGRESPAWIHEHDVISAFEKAVVNEEGDRKIEARL